MSDSSSEDEIASQMIQSVDKHFLNDLLFSGKSKTNSHADENNTNSKLPPSLRPTDNKDDVFTETGLTKSNQKFVANKLSKRLDKTLDKLISKDICQKDTISRENVNGGVLLFSDSSQFVSENSDCYPILYKKRKRKNNISEEEIESRCKTVAVSSDWISSGVATKGWCKNTKGEVINAKKVKTKNSTIECELIDT